MKTRRALFLFVFCLLNVTLQLVTSHPRGADEETGGCGDLVVTQALVLELNQQFDEIPPMSKDDVAYILQHAGKAKRSVIFANVQWSPNSLFFRKRYSRLVAQYHAEFPGDAILFHYVDCTETGFELFTSLPGWTDLPGDRFIHGNGEVFWLENGRIMKLDSVTNSSEHELMAITRTVFQNAG